ncbi:MAG: ABC transporter substrate-binding protein [Gemmatimonadota bacterium]
MQAMMPGFSGAAIPTGSVRHGLFAARFRLLARLAAFVMIVAPVACSDADPIVVGVALGVESRGARLAYEDAMRNGLPIEIDTIFLQASDNRAAPAIQAAEQLVSIPQMVAVIGHSNSAASMAAAPIYNRHQIVQLAPHSTAVLYSEAGPYSYRMVSPDDRQGQFLATHLTAAGHGRRAALLYVNDDYGRSLRHELLSALTPGAIEWVIDAPHAENTDSASIARTVTVLAESKPQIIVWIGRGAQLTRIIPDIRKAVGNVPILAGDGVASATRTVETETMWDSVRYVDLVDLEVPELREFREHYRTRFGVEPTGPQVLAYDAMAAVLEAIRGGARTGADIRDYFDSFGRSRPVFPGIAGPVMFDQAGNVDRAYVLRYVPKARL